MENKSTNCDGLGGDADVQANVGLGMFGNRLYLTSAFGDLSDLSHQYSIPAPRSLCTIEP